MKHTDEITIDIETIPNTDKWVWEMVEKEVKPPANIKKQETLDKWIKEKKPAAIEEKLSKGGLDAAIGHVICIGYAVNDEPAVAHMAETPEDESVILNTLLSRIATLQAPTFIGHNLAGFDIKFLKQRCMVLGLDYRLLPYDAKPWDAVLYDTMTEWDAKNYTKLDKLAKAFGLEGKTDGMDGSQVWDYYKAGRFDEIAAYCADDVELTRNVANKMRRL